MISRAAAWMLAAAHCLACATAGERAPAPAGPPPFQGVRKVALLRWNGDPGAVRARETLDALAQSLVARGLEARAVEAGPGDEPRGADRVHSRLDGRIAGGQQPGRYARRAEALGAAAGEVVRALGVDAIAMYHRFDRLPSALPEVAPLPDPFARAPPVLWRPVGALSLVDRDGNALWYEWGGQGAELDPSAAVNAAEAIDLLVRALMGEQEDG